MIHVLAVKGCDGLLAGVVGLRDSSTLAQPTNGTRMLSPLSVVCGIFLTLPAIRSSPSVSPNS